MELPFSITCDLESETATSAFAERLAPCLRPGDTLLLSGPIGAGKTHFARSLIRARLKSAGRDEDVPSPTYTLVQTYSDGDVEIWHADLYRLSHPDELIELGLDDAFLSSIVLVEWPDRLGSEAPRGALHLDFRSGPTDRSRSLSISSEDARWQDLIHGVLPESQST